MAEVSRAKSTATRGSWDVLQLCCMHSDQLQPSHASAPLGTSITIYPLTRLLRQAQHLSSEAGQQDCQRFYRHQQTPSSPGYDRSAARALEQAIHVEAWDPVRLTLVSVSSSRNEPLLRGQNVDESSQSCDKSSRVPHGGGLAGPWCTNGRCPCSVMARQKNRFALHMGQSRNSHCCPCRCLCELF